MLREIKRALPSESVVYLGDTARVPYGAKSKETIVRYSLNNMRFLLDKDVKMVVVACNTASAYAIPELANISDTPVLGVVEGGVKSAVTQNAGRIGVIGTEATIRSGAYSEAINTLAPESRVTSKACPLFVSLVEEGWVDNDIARAIAREYLGEFVGAIDTLVLGCTHYPLLKNTIRDTLGPEVSLIDSAERTAQLVLEKLSELGIMADTESKGSVIIAVTDSPERSVEVGQRMLGDIVVEKFELVDIVDI